MPSSPGPAGAGPLSPSSKKSKGNKFERYKGFVCLALMFLVFVAMGVGVWKLDNSRKKHKDLSHSSNQSSAPQVQGARLLLVFMKLVLGRCLDDSLL